MCGIFAYLNYHVPRTRREILEILLKGLQRLEYRGYDSPVRAVPSLRSAGGVRAAGLPSLCATRIAA
ncbi:hypothetical protein ANANG_G00190460 [Anguilla anguilla]|uniref:Glutamine amidotransferase type-2 domain-containing protein n=1 Tax=Anguilla anguilla TaxID=7936 RepID=A0A9D3RRH8_ANGAN|nr:hypothetical protein ANANG_G00190460 [Anguilla anguilla]